MERLSMGPLTKEARAMLLELSQATLQQVEGDGGSYCPDHAGCVSIASFGGVCTYPCLSKGSE
jgi:hypothetical protein